MKRNALCGENVVLLGVFSYYKKRLLVASCRSVGPSSWNSSAPNGRMLEVRYFRKYVEKIQVLF
jgi:hypothetical protein